MLFEPSRTAYDLNFRLFGVEVRVHPLFWLLSALLGPHDLQAEHCVLLLVVWIACVFVSILLHELGHVLVGRLFGSHGHIVLYSFGGLAVGSNDLPSRWLRIAVLLAGPGLQLVLFALVKWVALPALAAGKLDWVRPGTPPLILLFGLLFRMEIN